MTCGIWIIVGNVISVSMISWAALSEYDFGPISSYIVPFIRQGMGICTLMVGIESMILRFWTEYIWKRIPPLNTEFTAVFLSINNFVFCLLVSVFGFKNKKCEIAFIHFLIEI